MARLSTGPVEYRLERCSGSAVIVFHGGHMRAGIALGEDVFTDPDHTVLVPSRPGYGRTPLRTGTSPSGFADVTRELCDHLGIDHVAAVLGISAGGRTAITMAARYPEFVQRLILENAPGFLPYPDRRTRLAAHLAFNAVTEKATWAAVRALMRFTPAVGLRLLLRDLSTESVGDVLSALDDEERARLIALFSRLRSGRGFLNDLRSAPDVTSEITRPTLVIASRKDGSVPFAHAESLVSGIRRAELVESDSESHFLWFGSDYPAVADRIRRFLACDLSGPEEP
ncbi:alpha/beta fold hydrolase [Haloactinomyces albus]|uniref:Pimeloyl-ACP methyl ester carboxylesterase n=1 Tax=Haloactinomyces albus TaxID=1352928 RepID=A0AAE4CN68_9ACTN|nr:alpha/beta hydrolase [Haloactinomyces albus]MDR7300343.1 pimeloyl-ACP methyl ester carboxylesterase [Haloactinomyces albus]